MNCIRHPKRPAFSICQKFSQGYCEECCTCTDPKGYCKFRTQCIGWNVCRSKGKRAKGEKEETRKTQQI